MALDAALCRAQNALTEDWGTEDFAQRIRYGCRLSDLDLKKHTAEMSFAYQKCHLRAPFDSDHMQEMIERKGRGSVRLIVAPPLYRELTYDKAVRTSRLILQAQVCSSILERLPRRGYKKAIISVYTTKVDQTSAELLRQQQSQYHSGHESYDRRLSRDSRGSSAGRR